jgi:tetratricopeptide (TPR) repeat protein
MECLVLWHRAIPVLDEQEDAGAHDAWTDDVTSRVEGVGGRVVLRMGSTLVVLFEMHDAHAALAWGLETLDRADALDPSMAGLRVALGVAVGEVEKHGHGLLGGAFDRAQLLANRARFGELVLDPACHAVARDKFLFARTVNTGSAGLRGDAIDRNHAFLADCRAELAHLRQPGLLAPIEEASCVVIDAAQKPGSVRLVLRGPSGAGARRLCARLIETLAPPLSLHVAGVPGGLEPLGSLRHALLHQFGSEAAVLARFPDLDDGARGDLTKLLRGDVVSFAEARALMHNVLRSSGEGLGKSVLLLEPVGGIDPSTVKLLNEVIDEPGAEAILVVRLSEEGRVPTSIMSRGVLESTLPRLAPSLARTLAAQVLGEPEGSGLASRVAAIGGDTPLGVIEAARALVAAGDLIHEKGRFRFRLSPPSADGAVPLERLLADRLRSVDATAYRVLEVVSLLPQGAGDDALVAVAVLDGLAEEELQVSLAELASGWLLEHRTEWRTTSEQLRHVVLAAMPPARRAELYRFTAEATAALGAGGVFSGATLAYYQAEGGDAEAGAKGLLTAALAAADSGHLRGALRLAAAAVQFLPDDDTRRVAAHVSQTIKRRESEANPAREASVGESMEISSVVGAAATVRAIDAIRARDFERAERYVELGIAQGRSLAAADRLRVALAVLRGSTEAAREAYAHLQQRGHAERPGELPRGAIAHALVLLQERDAKGAVRESLRALQGARKEQDPRGEQAALTALATCYRALARPEDAATLVARAQPMTPPPSTSMV